jgi:hypothetical protein
MRLQFESETRMPWKALLAILTRPARILGSLFLFMRASPPRFENCMQLNRVYRSAKNKHMRTACNSIVCIALPKINTHVQCVCSEIHASETTNSRMLAEVCAQACSRQTTCNYTSDISNSCFYTSCRFRRSSKGTKIAHDDLSADII